MWEVDNRTPFSAERGWVRDRSGAEIWLVAIKCTFDIRPDGTTRVASEQPPVLREPTYLGSGGESSIRYDSDLVLAKRTTDVIVVGHAYAPRGRAVTEMEVGIRVGAVQKVLRVVGDRRWLVAGASSPQPFTALPLIYERAFGGTERESTDRRLNWDRRNPVGPGFGATSGDSVGIALPNIEYPGEPITSWKQRPRPAGFGAVAAHWLPRAAYAGTYDERWMRERQPLLPDDFDERFFQCAPADQQAPAFFRGGEPVALIGLHPDGDVRCALPAVSLRLVTMFYDGTRQAHPDPLLHTVILEPDAPRVSVVWHSALPCHFKVQKLARTVVSIRGSVEDAEALNDLTDEVERA